MPNLADALPSARDSLPAPRGVTSSTALARYLVGPLSMLAFWTAIVLPVIYLPYLLAGLETPEELAVFLGLLGLHLVTLRVGQLYRRNLD